ncbi:MAG: SpoIIE family protein phosphatase [Planctomycetota bacterium]|nr:SpoIIE family protein phosphatase [Planctomycetota bacterium]
MLRAARTLLPFRLKLLLGILAVGGSLLLVASILLRNALKQSFTETLASSMASAAAGLAIGLSDSAVETVERAARAAGWAGPPSTGSAAPPVAPPTPAELDRLRQELVDLRSRLVAEFPADWAVDEGKHRHPDLLIVLRETADAGRVMVSTKADSEGEEYRFHPQTSAVERWSRLTYDVGLVENERGAHVGGRSPIRGENAASTGLLVVEAESSLLSTVSEPLNLIAGIVFTMLMLALLGLGLVIAWWMNRPIGELDAAMSRVSSGDFAVRLSPRRKHDEFDALVERFNEMAAGLEAHRAVREELTLASQVQQHLLPAGLPSIEGYELCHAVQYCDQTGGDSIDCFALDCGRDRHATRWAVGVSDVSGHGIAAAMLTSWTRATMRAYADRCLDEPNRLLAEMNRLFLRDAPTGRFLTCFYGVLAPGEHRLSWASAGHEPGILISASSGDVRRLMSTGVPVGVLEETLYEIGAPVRFEPGDLLYIGTDGMCDARSMTGGLFGRERLERLLSSSRGEPLDAIRDRLLRAEAVHRGSEPARDDLSFVLVRRRA